MQLRLWLCRDTTLKLQRKVEDLEDVRYLVGVLNEVRECYICAGRPQSFRPSAALK